MKLANVLVITMMSLMFFIASCGDDEKAESKNVTVCTEAGNECANNDNGKTSCIDLICSLPATFGQACSKADHSECAETEVCLPAAATDYGMTNAQTCSTMGCVVVIENEQATQSDCPEGYLCISLEGEYDHCRPMVKDAKSICITMDQE